MKRNKNKMELFQMIGKYSTSYIILYVQPINKMFYMTSR